VAPEAVRAEFKKNTSPALTYTVSDEEMAEGAEAAEAEEMPRPSPLELHLLKLLFLHDELADLAMAHLELDWITHPQVRHIVDLRLAAQEHATWHSLMEFLDSLESPAASSLITEAVTEARKLPDPQTQLADVILKLRNQALDRQIAALTQQISLPETGDEAKLAALRELQQLRERKRTPLTARAGG
jgi:hypothetical protein